jgi:ketosteroid isomerase-like protein
VRTKQLTLVSLVLTLCIAPVFAQPPQSERTAAAVMTVEHEWLAALNRHDVTALARILGREFIDSDFEGNAVTRAQYLAYFARPVSHPAPRVAQGFEDTTVRFLDGGDVAIVTGLVVSRPAMTSPDAVRHSRFTDVFVWRGGRWQAVSSQETHFSPAKG